MWLVLMIFAFGLGIAVGKSTLSTGRKALPIAIFAFILLATAYHDVEHATVTNIMMAFVASLILHSALFGGALLLVSYGAGCLVGSLVASVSRALETGSADALPVPSAEWAPSGAPATHDLGTGLREQDEGGKTTSVDLHNL